jgi:hypothetical protein
MLSFSPRADVRRVVQADGATYKNNGDNATTGSRRVRFFFAGRIEQGACGDALPAPFPTVGFLINGDGAGAELDMWQRRYTLSTMVSPRKRSIR